MLKVLCYYRRTFPGRKKGEGHEEWSRKMKEENELFRGVLERVDVVMNNPRYASSIDYRKILWKFLNYLFAKYPGMN